MKLSTFLFAASAGTLVSSLPTKSKSGFKWLGTSESCAEFGETTFPGALGTDYIWPDTASIDKLVSAGLNIFRVPFLMERLVPDQLTGSVNETYLEGLKSTVSHITDQGAHAVIDPHNYGRYYDKVISSPEDFGGWWTTVAKIFADNKLVIFDTNNEYNTMDQDLVVKLNQAAIDAIRGAGANSQYIFVEGNSWTGAWTWTDINDSMKSLKDPADMLIYEMHQYLDEDGSGTHEQCVSATIGKERVTDATKWLKDNGKLGVIGEFAGGNNDVCKQAITGLLDYMSENSDVWTGALWWAAGPWWADYMYSLEPETGVAYQAYLSTLEQYKPSA